MLKVNPEQLREVAAECRRNAPKLEEATEINMVQSSKNLYEETSIESFNVLHEKDKAAKAKTFDPISELFIEVAGVLDELADNADQVSNSIM